MSFFNTPQDSPRSPQEDPHVYGVASNVMGIDPPVLGGNLVNFATWQHGD
jgi:hypothetical protein